jgi:hypothetical protein
LQKKCNIFCSYQGDQIVRIWDSFLAFLGYDKKLHINLKNGVGYILGGFLTNSFGHTGIFYHAHESWILVVTPKQGSHR